jgi:hypothetical protein
MKGKLGAIFRDDKQVGGFVDWEQETILNVSSSPEGNAIHKFASWRLTAPSYWLFDAVRGQIIIRLYLTDTGYWQGTGYISSPMRKIYDALIHEQFEIIGEGVLEGKS